MNTTMMQNENSDTESADSVDIFDDSCLWESKYIESQDQGKRIMQQINKHRSTTLPSSVNNWLKTIENNDSKPKRLLRSAVANLKQTMSSGTRRINFGDEVKERVIEHENSDSESADSDDGSDCGEKNVNSQNNRKRITQKNNITGNRNKSKLSISTEGKRKMMNNNSENGFFYFSRANSQKSVGKSFLENTRKNVNNERNGNTATKPTDSSNNISSDGVDKLQIEPKVKRKRIYMRPYMCDICGKRFRRYSYLENHINQHNNVRPFKCSFGMCNNTYTSQYLLDCHVKYVHNKVDHQRLCSYCGEKFLSKVKLKAHEAIHKLPEGAETPKPYKCMKCDKPFDNKSKFHKHMYAHRTVLKCSICQEVFMTAAPLRYHMEDVHGIKKEFKCSICGKIFNNSSGLRIHKKYSHSFVLKFFCDICDKGFKQKHHIEQHMITHSDERPISCPECDETFKRKTHLKQHVAAFHQNKKR